MWSAHASSRKWDCAARRCAGPGLRLVLQARQQAVVFPSAGHRARCLGKACKQAAAADTCAALFPPMYLQGHGRHSAVPRRASGAPGCDAPLERRHAAVPGRPPAAGGGFREPLLQGVGLEALLGRHAAAAERPPAAGGACGDGSTCQMRLSQTTAWALAVHAGRPACRPKCPLASQPCCLNRNSLRPLLTSYSQPCPASRAGGGPGDHSRAPWMHCTSPTCLPSPQAVPFSSRPASPSWWRP